MDPEYIGCVGAHPLVEGGLAFLRATTDRVARPSRQGGRVAQRQEAAPCGFQSRSTPAIQKIGRENRNSNRFAPLAWVYFLFLQRTFEARTLQSDPGGVAAPLRAEFSLMVDQMANRHSADPFFIGHRAGTPPGCDVVSNRLTGGIASLDPRLIAGTLPGCKS